MPELTLNPPADPAPTEVAAKPVFLDDAPAAPAAEQPNIHGFANVTFTTAYLTPRGLLVFDKGVVIQPIVGLVLPIGDFGPIKNYTWVAGVWNCITASQGDPGVGGWQEMDFFFSQSGTIADVIKLNLTYGEWNFPQSVPVGMKPKAEQNLDLKISYDDSKMWGDSGFSLNPYVDCWWAIAGSSTVTFGREGGTGYFEFGIVPTFTVKAIPDYPIKVTMPTYVSMRPAKLLLGHRAGEFRRGVYVGEPVSASLLHPRTVRSLACRPRCHLRLPDQWLAAGRGHHPDWQHQPQPC